MAKVNVTDHQYLTKPEENSVRETEFLCYLTGWTENNRTLPYASNVVCT